MIYVLLPAYNEKESLPLLISGIMRSLSRKEKTVIVIDDGSTDGTSAAVEQAFGSGVRIVRHDGNRGLGRALMTGLIAIGAPKDEDSVFIMDSDNTHPPEHIPCMLQELSSGSDIVIASRYTASSVQSGVPLSRHILSLLSSSLFRILFRAEGVRDYTCGFRGYSGYVINRASAEYGEKLVTEKGFVGTLQLLLRLIRFSRRNSEIPLELRYGDRKGKSKMNVPLTILQYIRFLIRSLFER